MPSIAKTPRETWISFTWDCTRGLGFNSDESAAKIPVVIVKIWKTKCKGVLFIGSFFWGEKKYTLFVLVMSHTSLVKVKRSGPVRKAFSGIGLLFGSFLSVCFNLA